MPKKTVSVEIPLELAKLLSSEPDDMKNLDEYDNVQKVCRSLLRVMLSAAKL